jgi:hypothetical protein
MNNIDKATRRRSSSHSWVLIGYIPNAKFLYAKNDTARRAAKQQFFHDCMRRILEPLILAGNMGTRMVCGDGRTRLIFPILSNYIGDAPEQSLVTCVLESRCPKCTVPSDRQGDRIPVDREGAPLRNPQRTLRILKRCKDADTPTTAFTAEGLRPNFRPFWEHLPHSNIFQAITPDVLHQLHQGLIGEHLLPWMTSIAHKIGKDIVDMRFQSQTPFPSLRHFKEGISVISQWSGSEHREAEKVLVGIFAGSVPDAAMCAARALLKIVYLMRWQAHTDASLQAIDDAIDAFHNNKHAFVTEGCREDFNFPKLHSLEHYVDSLRLFGPADGYSTEISERLHIDYAKHAYLATNRRDYIAQMTKWIQRREKLAYFRAYQEWFDEDNFLSNRLAQAAAEAHQVPEPRDRRFHGPESVYSIAKQPGLKASAEELAKDHGIPDMSAALEKYLRTCSHEASTVQIPADQVYGLYRQMTLHHSGNTKTGLDEQRERIRAVPAVSGGRASIANPAAFSTVLVRVPKSSTHTDGTAFAGELSCSSSCNSRLTLISGLHVARVKALFDLPQHLRGLSSIPTRLAYIEWYTPFGPCDPVVGLRAVKPAWSSHERRVRKSDIIPIDAIVQAAHLQPDFRASAMRRWNADRVLDECDRFWFNTWVTPRTWAQFETPN